MRNILPINDICEAKPEDSKYREILSCQITVVGGNGEVQSRADLRKLNGTVDGLG